MRVSMGVGALQMRRRGSALGGAAEAWLGSERHQLPLLVPVALGLGIALWFGLPWTDQRIGAAIVAAAVAAVGVAASGLLARVLCWGGLLVVAGLGLAEMRSASVAAPVLADRFSGEIAGVVESAEVTRGGERFRFRLVPDDPALPRHVRISAKGERIAGVVPGARVKLHAALMPPAGPSLPGGYDFARRAWFSETGATGYPLGPVIVTARAPPASGLIGWLGETRAAINARFAVLLPGAAGAIGAAFVTGEQGGIPPPVAQAMRDAGLAHLLSISGLHIAIVVGGTLWFVRRLLTLSPWIALRWPVKAIAAGVAALAGVAYTLLAGGEVPTVRSCIATLIVLVGIVIGREALTLRMIAAGALIILCIRPEALLGPSFQLSFAAVTGIVALYQSRFGRWLSDPARSQGWGARLARHGLALVVTGLVAEAMLAATALYHFNRAGMFGVVDYIRDMWDDATGASTADVAIADLPGARCSRDACVADLVADGRRWRLLATLSRDRVPRERFSPACAAADIVISARRLPPWCAPRWLKLDRAMLGTTGAVAIWLGPEPRIATVAARIGDHPWMPAPAPWTPRARVVVPGLSYDTR